MSRRSLKAYVTFLFTGIVIYVCTWTMMHAGWISQFPSFTVPILLFFFGVTTLIYRYINWFLAYGAAAQMQFYLGSILVKLLMGCGFLWIMIIIDRVNITSNAVLFLVSYALFTGVEIQQLMAAKKD